MEFAAWKRRERCRSDAEVALFFFKLSLNSPIHHTHGSPGFVILPRVSGHLQRLSLLPNDPSLIPACDRLGAPRRGTVMDASDPSHPSHPIPARTPRTCSVWGERGAVAEAGTGGEFWLLGRGSSHAGDHQTPPRVSLEHRLGFAVC